MLGYSREEYVGRNVAEFNVERASIDHILACLERGDILKDYPARMRCKDGSIRDVLITSSVYRKEGRFIHARCFSRDVTGLKRAEEAKAALAAIVESSDDAIASKNLNGIVMSWNAGAERLFGYKAEEMIGESILRIIPPERHEEEAMILSRLRRGESIEHYETVRMARDGRRVDISLTVSPIRNSEGKIIGASKIARDITERKRVEEFLAQAKEDLLQANEQLERRVQERTADLERANAALLKNIEEQRRLEEQLRQAQKMESIGTLAGGIAHDFNNSLNIIKAYATLISARYSGNRHIVDTIKIIDEEIDRGATVVRQLLTLARKTQALLEPTDANRVIGAVTELIKETFPKTIEVKLELDPALPAVLADANQITQALLNICLNARDAMPAGGKLTLRTESLDRKAVQERHPEAEDHLYVCVAVTDTGKGIDDSVQPRIFEPFFTTKGIGEGTGLGLAMVYGIIENHHGLTDFDSKVGLGTTFRLYLPVLQAGDPSATDKVPGGKAFLRYPSNRRATILVVEDEQPMVQLLERALRRAGYHFMTAFDGAEAIDLYQAHRDEIDIALMDLGLPKISGSEVIRVMKEETPRVDVIVTTGYLEPELKSELSRFGVQDYIHKPYSIEAVLETIQSVLNRRSEEMI